MSLLRDYILEHINDTEKITIPWEMRYHITLEDVGYISANRYRFRIDDKYDSEINDYVDEDDRNDDLFGRRNEDSCAKIDVLNFRYLTDNYFKRLYCVECYHVEYHDKSCICDDITPVYDEECDYDYQLICLLYLVLYPDYHFKIKTKSFCYEEPIFENSFVEKVLEFSIENKLHYLAKIALKIFKPLRSDKDNYKQLYLNQHNQTKSARNI